MPLVLLCSGKVEWVRRRPQVRRRTAPSSSTSTRPVVRAIHGCISSRWPPRPPLNCIFVLCIYALSHMSILPWTRGRQQEAVARRSVAAWLSPSSSPPRALTGKKRSRRRPTALRVAPPWPVPRAGGSGREARAPRASQWPGRGSARRPRGRALARQCLRQLQLPPASCSMVTGSRRRDRGLARRRPRRWRRPPASCSLVVGSRPQPRTPAPAPVAAALHGGQGGQEGGRT